MKQSRQQTSQAHDSADEVAGEFELRELIRIVWLQKWIVVAATAIFTIVAIAIALWLPNVYRAEALLAPNEDESTGGLAALAGQYGGLASMAGIDISSNAGSNTTLGIEVLQSKKFITDFIERHEILVPVMAAEGWDPDTGATLIDNDLFDTASGEWVREVSPPRQTVPSLQEAFEEFDDMLTVSQDNKTGFVRVSLDHYSPNEAKQWVDWMIEDVNSTIMAKDVDEAQQAIAYLQEQLDATSIADLRNVFFRLIEEQTKTIMLARVSPEYVFRTVDPAFAPEIHASPRRSLIAAVGILVGGMLGILAALIRHTMSQGRRAER